MPPITEGTRLSGDKVAGIIGGIMFVLLGIVFALLALKFRNQKQKKLPEMAYGRTFPFISRALILLLVSVQINQSVLVYAFPVSTR